MVNSRKDVMSGFLPKTLLQRMIVAAVCVSCMGVAWAQTAEDEVWTYVVKPGDTLYDISLQYMEDTAGWIDLARDAQITEPRHLQPGQVIRVPIDRLRHEGKEIQVAYHRGQATVSQGKLAAQPLVRNMMLSEGQIIETGADGFVSMVLPDGSRLLLSANSRLKIGQFRYVPDVDKVLVDFVLEKGYVESSVTPQPENTRFRVSTPVAVTGVRGTRFGVAVSSDGKHQVNDVIEGKVAVSASDGNAGSRTPSYEIMIQAGEGAVVRSGVTAPDVRALMPAPDLNTWPRYVHEESWQPPVLVASAAAAGYIVQVTPENEPNHVVFESRGELVPIGPLTDARYRVYVRSLDADAIPGAVAQHDIEIKLHPVPPLVQSPGNDQVIRLSTQELVCTNVPQVHGYFLQVARDRQFTQIVDEQISRGNCRFSFTPSETGVYYWRTASLDNSSSDVEEARGRFSLVSMFEVSKALDVPLSGEARSGDGKGIVLYWDNVAPDATYRVQVSDQIDFSNLLFSEETQATQIPLGITYSCKALYVRLQSIAPNGVESDFSQPRVLQAAQTWCTGDGVMIVDGQGEPIGIGAN